MRRKIVVTEEWKPVCGFEDVYEVSDQGRVRSYLKQGSAIQRRKRPCILKLNHNRQTGYMYIRLYHNSKTRLPVHRLVLETFVGPCPPDCEACHNNGIKSDNRLENLRWDTHTANIEESRNTRLTRAQVLRIKALYKGGTMQKVIADMFGVTQACISLIVNRVNWRHI